MKFRVGQHLGDIDLGGFVHVIWDRLGVEKKVDDVGNAIFMIAKKLS